MKGQFEMNSRERVLKSINHEQADKIPIDLGATGQTGISASTLYKFRKALNLPDKRIKVIEPYQILGDVEEDVQKAIGGDVVGLWTPENFMGTRNVNWKNWDMPDGTPTYMSGDFNYKVDSMGNVLAYPQGDIGCDPSMILAAGGSFFNSIDRVAHMNEADLNAKRDFKDDFSVYSEETAKYLEQQSKLLYEGTEYAIVGNFGGGGFGDVAAVPGHFLKNPKGVRHIDDWMMCHLLYPDYIKEVFDMQVETALKNLEIYKEAVGNRIQIITISGTDFGTQNGEFMSVDTYRHLYKPYHKVINDWVHKNTNWKTFYHTCGSVVNLLDDFVDVGVDILNPVQCSAKGMSPKMLKEKYGDQLVFWGGGVDTQHTLPFGTSDEVVKEVNERLDVFGKSGGFVFNTIHNIVAQTPVENLKVMYETVNKWTY